LTAAKQRDHAPCPLLEGLSQSCLLSVSQLLWWSLLQEEHSSAAAAAAAARSRHGSGDAQQPQGAKSKAKRVRQKAAKTAT
jgi:hypothetical protein